jgi:hypothetical protein
VDGALTTGRPAERRQAVRRPAAALDWVGSLRLRPGLEVALVNLSTGGALVETLTRLRPGARTALRSSGTGAGWAVTGYVSRAWVAAVEADRGVVYRGALVFDTALDFPEPGNS